MFDGAMPKEFSPAVEKLDEVIALLPNRLRWTKHRYTNLFGYRRCLVQILGDIDGIALLTDPILATAEEVTGMSFGSIPEFNDDSGTSFGRLVRVLRQTRANLINGRVFPRKQGAAASIKISHSPIAKGLMTAVASAFLLITFIRAIA